MHMGPGDGQNVGSHFLNRDGAGDHRMGGHTGGYRGGQRLDMMNNPSDAMMGSGKPGSAQYQDAAMTTAGTESGASNTPHGQGHMEGRTARGGHGSRYGIGANAGGPIFGHGGPVSLPPNFICERCKEPGHYIRDCPRNGDPLYNPSQHKGIPQNQQWRLLVTSDQFTKHRDRVLKSLMKQKEIYDFSERIAPKDSQ